MCGIGSGILDGSNKQCLDCPVDTYGPDDGNECMTCEDGYDTYNKTGAAKCHSKTFELH